MDKKISLEDSRWLWALSRGKLEEFYQKNYGTGQFKLTPGIGGSIVGQLFRDNARLLHMAYFSLGLDWLLILWTAFPEPPQKDGSLKPPSYRWDTSRDLDYNQITWMLFKALSMSLTVTKLDEIVEGDWRGLWTSLDKEFDVDNRPIRAAKSLVENSIYGVTTVATEVPVNHVSEVNEKILEGFKEECKDCIGLNEFCHDNPGLIRTIMTDNLENNPGLLRRLEAKNGIIGTGGRASNKSEVSKRVNEILKDTKFMEEKK